MIRWRERKKRMIQWRASGVRKRKEPEKSQCHRIVCPVLCPLCCPVLRSCGLRLRLAIHRRVHSYSLTICSANVRTTSKLQPTGCNGWSPRGGYSKYLYVL